MARGEKDGSDKEQALWRARQPETFKRIKEVSLARIREVLDLPKIPPELQQALGAVGVVPQPEPVEMLTRLSLDQKKLKSPQLIESAKKNMLFMVGIIQYVELEQGVPLLQTERESSWPKAGEETMPVQIDKQYGLEQAAQLGLRKTLPRLLSLMDDRWGREMGEEPLWMKHGQLSPYEEPLIPTTLTLRDILGNLAGQVKRTRTE